ncbi:MAG: cysteine rich repeat-containing protein [Rhodospirillales bacterium]
MKNIVRRYGFIIGTALAVTALSGPAFAQGMGQGMMGQGMGHGMMGQGGGMVMSQCVPEIKKHCADVPHGSAEIPACLEKHKAELSDDCKKALDQRGPMGGPMGGGMGR